MLLDTKQVGNHTSINVYISDSLADKSKKVYGIGQMDLCLGTAQFGMNYGIQRSGQPTLSDALDMLDIAIQNGIDAFDTAASYGTAEEIIGEYLKKHPNSRARVELFSKPPASIVDGVPQEKHATAIKESLLKSLCKLKTDYLDGYILHNPSHIFCESVVESLVQMKNEGIVKMVGVSIYTPDEAKAGIDRGLDLLQIPYSVFDQRFAEQGMLSFADSRGVNLYARSAFTQGLLLMRDNDIPSKLEKAQPLVRRYTRLCEDFGFSRLHFAIAFVGRQQSIKRLVFGVDNKEQLIEIINANREHIPEESLKEAERQFAGLDEEIIMPSKWGI